MKLGPKPTEVACIAPNPVINLHDVGQNTKMGLDLSISKNLEEAEKQSVMQIN